jgi:hypothetical protein
MKKVFLVSLLVAIIFSCQPKKYSVSKYFSDNERDTLLTNIITYVFAKAPNATTANRFDAQFRQFYVKSLPNFRIEKYHQTPDGWNYFFIIRPVGNSPKYKRGVLGKFRLKEDSLIPEAFEEVVNTPHLEEKVLIERGSFLFQELIKKGNLDNYLAMKHYIEWPDANLVYDKNINEWVGRKQSTVHSPQKSNKP